MTCTVEELDVDISLSVPCDASDWYSSSGYNQCNRPPIVRVKIKCPHFNRAVHLCEFHFSCLKVNRITIQVCKCLNYMWNIVSKV
jgi:hypothetical protein